MNYVTRIELVQDMLQGWASLMITCWFYNSKELYVMQLNFQICLLSQRTRNIIDTA